MWEYTTARCKRALLFLTGVALFSGAALSVFAQDAALLDKFVAQEQVSRGQLIELLAEIGLSVTVAEADRAAGAPGAPGAAIRADELAVIIVQAADLPHSLGYRLFSSPRYALRMARTANIYPENPRRLAGGMTMSGTEVLSLVREPVLQALEEGADTELVLPAARWRARSNGPWTEWSVEQEIATEIDDDTFVFRNRSDLSLQLILSSTLELQGSFRARGSLDQDGDTEGDLLVPGLFLGAYREPGPGGVGATGRLGRLAVGPLTADGAHLRADTARMTALIGAGYTGFVDQTFSPVPEVLDDQSTDRDRVLGSGSLAPRRLAAEAGLLFPELIGRHSPGFGALSVIKPGWLDKHDGADRLNLHHIGLSLAGPVGLRTFYDLSTGLQFGDYSAGELGKVDREYLGWIAEGELRHFPGGDGRQRVRLGVRLASGGKAGEGSLGLNSGTGRHTGYVPVSGLVPWQLYEGTGTNAGSVELEYVQRISRKLRLSGSVMGIARLSPGDTGALEVDERDTAKLPVGGELALGLGIQPISGVIFDLNGNIFLPWQSEWGGAYSNNAEPGWKLSLATVIEL